MGFRRHALLLVTVLGAACPSSDQGDQAQGPGAGTGASAAHSAGWRGYYEAVCDLYQRCGLQLYGDQAQCVDSLLCNAEGLFEFFDADEQQLQACAAWLRQQTCDWEPLTLSQGPCTAVLDTWTGSSDVEFSCGGQACGAGEYCDRSERACPRCAQEVPLGQPCTRDRQCLGQAFCNDAGTCEPLRAEGMSCRYHSDCQGLGSFPRSGLSTLRCVDDVCTRPGELGAACRFFTDCAGPLTCIAGTCTQRLSPGEACQEHQDCAFSHFCLGGTCQQLCGFEAKALGKACAFDFHCDSGHCDEETNQCTASLPGGAACERTAQCGEYGYCTGGSLCAPKLADGEACVGDSWCASDYCEGGTCQQPPSCG